MLELLVVLSSLAAVASGLVAWDARRTLKRRERLYRQNLNAWYRRTREYTLKYWTAFLRTKDLEQVIEAEAERQKKAAARKRKRTTTRSTSRHPAKKRCTTKK